MIQRNAVIQIDQIEQDRARGVPAWEAIVESGKRVGWSISVIPAQAGIQGVRIETAHVVRSREALDPRLRGDDGKAGKIAG